MIKKTIFLLVVVSSLLFAKDGYLNIDADFFEADESKKQMHFKGNVKMSKNSDVLEAKSLLINTEISKEDKNKQIPKDYMATGDVRFTVHTDEDNVLKGKGDKVYYYPKKQEYVIVGNGYLEDLKKEKKVSADKIYVNEKTGHIKIDGGENKPVQFRLKLDEETQTSE